MVNIVHLRLRDRANSPHYPLEWVGETPTHFLVRQRRQPWKDPLRYPKDLWELVPPEEVAERNKAILFGE